MVTLSPASDRLNWTPAVASEEVPLRVGSNPVTPGAGAEGGGTDGRGHPTPVALARTALNGAAPATHRRRSRWFELNPGCFGRAALVAAGAAAAMAAGGSVLWMLRWARRGRRVLRVVRTVRDANRQLRGEG